MLYLIYRNILLILMRSTILVGGQAVIEGVMMRVPGAYATAVRKSDGSIAIDYHTFNSITTKKSIYALPIIRGMIHLYESMKIGYSSLDWSAQLNEGKLEQKKNKSRIQVDYKFTSQTRQLQNQNFRCCIKN